MPTPPTPTQACGLIALADDRVVGFIELLRTPRPPINRPEAAELASLYVLESEHRHGVGRALVEAGRQAVGNDRLVLWVVGFNTNAQGFYRHIGFHETGLTQTEDTGAGTRNDQLLAGRWSSCRSSCCARRRA